MLDFIHSFGHDEINNRQQVMVADIGPNPAILKCDSYPQNHLVVNRPESLLESNKEHLHNLLVHKGHVVLLADTLQYHVALNSAQFQISSIVVDINQLVVQNRTYLEPIGMVQRCYLAVESHQLLDAD